jgi:hypothetical protein
MSSTRHDNIVLRIRGVGGGRGVSKKTRKSFERGIKQIKSEEEEEKKR